MLGPFSVVQNNDKIEHEDDYERKAADVGRIVAETKSAGRTNPTGAVGF